MTESANGQDREKQPPRVPVPFRMSPAGRDAIKVRARECGYGHYTAWIRDLVEAEYRDPKHNLTPKPKERKK